MSETTAPKKGRFDGIVFAVDFDGTCVTHEYPDIGRPIGATKVLKWIVEEGGKIILWTMRSDEKLWEATDWFHKEGIELYGVQRNPTQHWTNSPKCYAHIYIDDAALGCPLKPGLKREGQKDERPFVDWDAVEEMLKSLTKADSDPKSSPPAPSCWMCKGSGMVMRDTPEKKHPMPCPRCHEPPRLKR